jgi:DNA polymerase III subunit epsilon
VTIKLLYVDVETTGLACPQSGLIQLAGAIEVDGRLCERFDFHIRPFPGDGVTAEALTVNGKTYDEIAAYPTPEEVYRQFLALLGKYVDRYDRRDKFHLVAYNAAFDSEHLRAWFIKNKDSYFGSWFFHPPLDVMGMAAVALMSSRANLADFRLSTVAGALGLAVDPERAHDAGYDVGLTIELFHALMGPGKE